MNTHLTRARSWSSSLRSGTPATGDVLTGLWWQQVPILMGVLAAMALALLA